MKNDLKKRIDIFIIAERLNNHYNFKKFIFEAPTLRHLPRSASIRLALKIINRAQPQKARQVIKSRAAFIQQMRIAQIIG